jgi:N-acyl-D-aspartate/D-glutamate deacylase
MHFDILIRNGTVFDGSDTPGKRGDVGISKGRIAAVDTTLAGTAQKIIDAAGLAVTPGFIDIKTHSDFSLPVNPTADSKVRQGVTSLPELLRAVGHPDAAS